MVEAGKQWRSPVFAMSGAPAPLRPLRRRLSMINRVAFDTRGTYQTLLGLSIVGGWRIPGSGARQVSTVLLEAILPAEEVPD